MACLRSAVSIRAWSDSVRLRFWMATAACERKCSTSSASNGRSRPGWRPATLSTPKMPSRVTSGAQSIDASRVVRRRLRRRRPVVVEQLGQPSDRLAGHSCQRPAAPVEAMDLRRSEHGAHVVVERQREANPVALGLRPRDLLRDDAERVLAVLAHQQRRRVIVVRQRPDAVEDLVEEILRDGSAP